MDSRTRVRPDGATLHPEGPDQAILTRTEEERSENEGMQEHPLKAADPVAWEERRPTSPAPVQRAGPAAAQPAGAPASHAEATDLERRVLAHERILQSLIAHMAEAEPKFLVRLGEKFSEPMRMARHEHDYTDTEAYAEEFVRAVVRLDREAGRKAPTAAEAEPSRDRPAGPAPAGQAAAVTSPRFQLRKQNGVWEVLVDGRFHGHYLQEEQAQAVWQALSGPPGENDA